MEQSRILEVKNLRISFRTLNGTVKAVRGIDFSLYRGKTLAIVGESGSGKSVTSRAVMGILAGNKIVEEGEILYDGKDLLRISEKEYCKIRGSKIAMIFQDPMSSLNPIMKVGKQITESMRLKRKSEKKDAKKSYKYRIKRISEYIDSRNITYFTQEDLKDFKKIFSVKDNADLDFDVTRFDRITNSKLLSLQKAANNSKDANKRQAFLDLAKKYEDSRKIARETLVAKVEKVKASFAERIGLADNYNFDRLNKLSIELHKENESELQVKRKEAIEYLNNLEKELETADDSTYVSLISKNLKEIALHVNGCKNLLNETKDENIYTFVVSIKHLISEYKAALKREALAAKKAKKDAKKRKEGKNTDVTLKERAWASEIDTSSHSMVERLKDIFTHFIKYISSLQTEDSKKLEEDALEFIKFTTLNIKKAKHVIRNTEFTERAIKVLTEVGISEPEKRIKQYPFQFSGGMRQRIVIAIALSSNPEILICDEPTTALDVTIQAQILDLINDLKKRRNLSIIFITHNLGVVANMADDIAVMYAGKIVEYGTVDDIFYNPKHPYTWALLASMPDLHTKERLDPIPGTPPNMIIPPKGDAFAARNKYAMKIDFEKEPPLFQVSPTHFAATWLLVPNAPKVEPPKIVTERVNRMLKLNSESAEAKKHLLNPKESRR